MSIQFSFQTQRKAMSKKFKIPYNCTHFTCQQGNAQTPSSWVSTVCELRTFRCTSWCLGKAEEPEIKLPTITGSQAKQGNSKKIFTSVSLTTLEPLTVWITTNYGKFFKRWEEFR